MRATSPLEELEELVEECTGRVPKRNLVDYWHTDEVYYSRDMEDLLHEFCHFIVATPGERTQENLALGWSIWANTREAEACGLEIMLLDASGSIDHKKVLQWVLEPFREVTSSSAGRARVLERSLNKLWDFEVEHPGMVERLLACVHCGLPKNEETYV